MLCTNSISIMKHVTFIAISLVFLWPLDGLRADGTLRSKTPEGVRLYFIQPKSGQTVSREFDVLFGLSGMGVAPAGMNVENTGHHHLLIDVNELPDMNKPIPASDNIKHFGKGETQIRLKLMPGSHTLQLLLGNYLHIPHDKPVLSEKITVIVE